MNVDQNTWQPTSLFLSLRAEQQLTWKIFPVIDGDTWNTENIKSLHSTKQNTSVKTSDQKLRQFCQETNSNLKTSILNMNKYSLMQSCQNEVKIYFKLKNIHILC